jgi:hypothetical protein
MHSVGKMRTYCQVRTRRTYSCHQVLIPSDYLYSIYIHKRFIFPLHVTWLVHLLDPHMKGITQIVFVNRMLGGGEYSGNIWV